MESLGDTLRRAREGRGISVDQVCRDTNIAKRYVQALESDDFEAFPGEPYVLGFTRTYADYLGLSYEDLAQMYRAAKLQEQPVPIDELLKRGRTVSFPAMIAIIACGIAVLAGILFVLSPGKAQQAAESASRSPGEYNLLEGPLETSFIPGDRLVVDHEGKDLYVDFRGIEAGRAVLILPTGTEKRLGTGAERIDLDGDGIEDLLAQAGEPQASGGILLHFEAIPAPSPEAIVVAEAEAQESAEGQKILEGRPQPFPFISFVSFKGTCFFRYESDRGARIEAAYKAGDSINVESLNRVRIWSSNAGNTKLSLKAGTGNFEIPLGGMGEVIVKTILWVREPSGLYSLIVRDEA
jgi:transcriptional regulator with XRE-family HTH domain